ncbi:CPBP family intramembrane glutamic endopeptidase [Geothrix sp. PMB-07]|uniref:CPBP family intramembrane glutamic endopeptidase n=1 Tax=Geothrix sp. PMB-07 TaxID=3068640 RepID=UPI0027421FC1|nr:CPBP family intramembrane glutamic endopeptidase [Geothrix sp. PMB-07]WLT31987.1 CPBP family intramembrane metalloprotease [Geothrix sp. PMB-07]
MTEPETAAPLQKPYPGFAQALLVLLLFFLFGTLTSIPAALLAALKLHRWAAWATVLAQLSGTWLTLLVGRRLGRRAWADFFPHRPVSGLVWPLVPLATAGLLLVCNGVDAWVAHALPPPTWFERLFQDMGWPSLVLGAPLSEEPLFRGLILSGFLLRYGPRKAIIGSALLFALFHMNPWQFPIGCLAGLLFGWLTVRTGSLWPAVFAHFLNNLSASLTHTFHIPYLSDSRFQPWWIWGLGFLLLTAGLAALQRVTAESEGLLRVQDAQT